VGPGVNKVHLDAKAPAFSQAKPEIDSLSLDLSAPQQPRLKLTGKDFGGFFDTVTVLFQVGGADYTDATGKLVQLGGKDVQVKAPVFFGTDLEVTVPDTVALGTAKISVIRDVDSSGKDIRHSNVVQFPLTSGYTFAPQRIAGQLSVFDNRPAVPASFNPAVVLPNPNFNQLIAQIPVIGGLPQFVATTPDNTRAYVTTRHEIAVIDAIAMQQVGTIDLTGNADTSPFQIVIDHAGKFAYVTDSVSATVYVVNVDPNADEYNKCVGTIQNVPAVRHGLRGLAITNDDRRLYVAAPNRDEVAAMSPADDPKGSILVINVDLNSNQPPQWVKSLTADQAPSAVRATANPDVILFTNFRSDNTGLVIITGA